MIFRRSRFVHLLPVGQGRTLIVHAISHMRLPADSEISALLDYFSQARRSPKISTRWRRCSPSPPIPAADLRDAVEGTVMELQVAPDPDRDDAGRRTGCDGCGTLRQAWARPRGNAGELPAQVEGGRRVLLGGRRVLRPGGFRRVRAGASMPLLFGDCDIQMEADFLRREAARRGIDLHVAATFPGRHPFCGRAQTRRDFRRRVAGTAPRRRGPRERAQPPCRLYRACDRASDRLARNDLGADPDR